MSKIVNLQRRGQWIESLLSVRFDNLYTISNTVLDEILSLYDQYLIDNMVCPKCYSDLFHPDKMVETLHCHNCTWDEEFKVSLRKN
jgi:hypothetical protein